jgi:hypothetical protein
LSRELPSSSGFLTGITKEVYAKDSVVILKNTIKNCLVEGVEGDMLSLEFYRRVESVTTRINVRY